MTMSCLESCSKRYNEIFPKHLQSCERECAARVFLENCNCIPYYMPRFSPNVTMCGHPDAECIEKVQQEIYMERNQSFNCECYYGCDAIKYEMSFSSNPIFADAAFFKENHLTAQNVSSLQVFYQRSYFRGQKIEELIGFTEFLCESTMSL